MTTDQEVKLERSPAKLSVNAYISKVGSHSSKNGQ
jgi:hypothetical protein